MAENANARRGPGAAVRLDEQTVAENSATTINGQAVTLPTLAEARARLLEVIRQKPAPVVNRAPDAVRIPTEVAPDRLIARIVGVTPRAVAYWRAGQRRPRWRNERKLQGLRFLIRRAGS